jgi:hypothetical protein
MTKQVKYYLMIVLILFTISALFLFSVGVFAATPVLTTVTAGGWVKVATGITTGQIHFRSTAPDACWQTYRDTTDPAPTLQSEGVRVQLQESYDVSAAAAIDVYIWCDGADGQIRVDE